MKGNCFFYSLFSFGCFAIILLAIGAFYAHTNVEDLELAILSRELGMWKAWLHLAVTYDGRYLTNFLHGFNPLVWNNVLGYKWMVLGALGLFNLGVFFAIRVFFKDVGWAWSFVGSLTFSSIYFQSCGSLAYALYWMGSSFVYLYPSILLLFIIALFFRYATAQPKQRNFYFLPLACLLFLGIGSSELYLPFYFIVSILLPIVLYIGLPAHSTRVIPLSIISIVSIWFMVSAPGVSYRFDSIELKNHFSWQVLFSSLENYGKEISSLFSVPTFLPIILSAWLTSEKIWSPVIAFRKNQIIIMLCFFIVVPYLMTLPFFITKASLNEFPNRVYIPVIFIQHTLLFFFIVPALVMKNQHSNMSKSFLKYLGISLLLMLSLQILNGKGQLGLLYKELMSGKIRNFDKQMTYRYKLLEDSRNALNKHEMVCIDTLRDYPRSLFTHPDREYNRASTKWHKYIEGYFEIDEVRTYGDTTQRFQNIKFTFQ